MGAARREEMEPSPAKGKAQGRILVSTSLDAKDELEEVGIDSFPSASNTYVSLRLPNAPF